MFAVTPWLPSSQGFVRWRRQHSGKDKAASSPLHWSGRPTVRRSHGPHKAATGTSGGSFSPRAIDETRLWLRRRR
eukprot:CAMPEP_0176082020 /NCGR_PEP_ID=MMETSP0120_2-20121206/41027_1 /TAXON_ID=160619 /ORGANISM="Kryptoperidinium foliaceum, Strain CCMP 1326" /LENGTH=74 /DNA_ID=CAMNT_0017415787 /DNA_START=42 /DNA_END=263 /DNA_ORIENTATION=+